MKIKEIIVEKVLLTDVDGVILDWEAGFVQWAKDNGFTRVVGLENEYDISKQFNVTYEEGTNMIARFNASDAFGDLGSWRDSVEYLRRLSTEGWKIITITTAGQDPRTYGLRMANFEKVFGDGVVDELYILPLHGDKGDQLSKYTDSGFFWIEDKPKNAELGFKFGLQPLLMDNPHNQKYAGAVSRVHNWAEIYNIINN
ncbi:MAG: hypothetical protein EBY22_02345 [Gammaproteobacteria bacterium]|nr:hypothetical protein [Gammaproteobacteria bacterium]